MRLRAGVHCVRSIKTIALFLLTEYLDQGCGSGSKLKQNFVRQFPSQIFLKSKFESNQIKNTGVIHQHFFQKVVSAILYFLSDKIVLKN
jgi:hypothetical protein